MRWKKLSSTKLYEHPRISIYEDEVELPGGHKTKYMHFGQVLDSVMIIAVNTDGKILLQKEYSYPPDEVLYQFPGGALDQDESPEIGGQRELAEEAGLTGDLRPIGWYYANNRRSGQRQFVYIATNLSSAKANKDPEELFEDFWLTEEEIEQLIQSNQIRNSTTLAGWTLYISNK